MPLYIYTKQQIQLLPSSKFYARELMWVGINEIQ